MADAYRCTIDLMDGPFSPLQQVDWPAATAAGVELYVKRDELLDPRISGNKWRKLLPQLAWHLRQGKTSFATIGGVHSNHIPAFAAAMDRLFRSDIANICIQEPAVGQLSKGADSSYIANINSKAPRALRQAQGSVRSDIANICEEGPVDLDATDERVRSDIANMCFTDNVEPRKSDSSDIANMYLAAAKSPAKSHFVYVRGEIPSPLSPSLAFAKTCGLELRSATREQVRAWRTTPPSTEELQGATWIPEGGTNKLGLLGMASCYREIEQQLGQTPDAIVAAVGSGGTVAGLARKANCPIYAMDVVGDKGLPSRIQEILSPGAFKRIRFLSAQLKGFASGESAILQTMLNFKGYTGIQLDPIYTAKALLKLDQLLWRGEFAAGSKIVLVHTGGLQGLEPWMKRYWPPKAEF